MDLDNLYSVKELASKLKVSERTIRRWIAEGKLTAYKIGYKIYISKDDVNKIIKKVN